MIVRPPITARSGEVVVALDPPWALSLWPHLDGRSTHDGTYHRAVEAAAVLDVIAQLHEVPRTLFNIGAERCETFEIPGLARLLSLADGPWPGPLVGPYATAAQEMLHDHADDLHRLALLKTELATRAPSRENWVITHGEPHAANVVFTAGGPVLIDWDTAKVAPRERDLWMIATDGHPVGDANSDMLLLYRLQWDLSELVQYADRFADPNDEGPSGDAAWKDFVKYLHRSAHLCRGQ